MSQEDEGVFDAYLTRHSLTNGAILLIRARKIAPGVIEDIFTKATHVHHQWWETESEARILVEQMRQSKLEHLRAEIRRLEELEIHICDDRLEEPQA